MKSLEQEVSLSVACGEGSGIALNDSREYGRAVVAHAPKVVGYTDELFHLSEVPRLDLLKGGLELQPPLPAV